MAMEVERAVTLRALFKLAVEVAKIAIIPMTNDNPPNIIPENATVAPFLSGDLSRRILARLPVNIAIKPNIKRNANGMLRIPKTRLVRASASGLGFCGSSAGPSLFTTGKPISFSEVVQFSKESRHSCRGPMGGERGTQAQGKAISESPLFMISQ